jgi:hypothetical protein
MAGYVLLVVMSITWVPQMFLGRGSALTTRSDLSGATRGRSCAAYAASPPPTIRISIEPAALAPYADAESPVVFPGYLLPDDGCEEPAHAGS